MEEPDVQSSAHLTFWQRRALKQIRKLANKKPGEPLTQDDWAAYLQAELTPSGRLWSRFLHALPKSPRCGFCGAPFAGIGSRLVRWLGYQPSRKKPNLCATCVELSPPGGMTTEVGVLFADVRGFTQLSESSDPERVSALLRRFYASAENALFPEALIDKLIGDEVMALYPALFQDDGDPAETMMEGARKLLSMVGYGTEEGPFVEVGIGLDYGEAFVGNVGEGSLYDFTAVGDVVNVASRLQGKAKGGEIIASSRVAERLAEPRGERIEVELKGKSEPVAAYRSSVEEPVAA